MELEFSVHLKAPREWLFDFHTNPENLRALLKGWRGTEVLSTEGHLHPGSRTCVSERIGIFTFRFVFEHFVLDPPRVFGERMVKGFCRRFEHLHEFEAVGEMSNETIIRDRIRVELPWWLGGSLATHWFVARRLRRFFAHRHAAYRQLEAGGAWSA